MNYALITGASKGIGKSFALSLAKRHYDLLLVARTGALLEQQAAELSKTQGVTVKWLELDLSLSSAPGTVIEWVRTNGFEVSVLVNNAGYGLWGNFMDRPIAETDNMIRLNVLTLVDLTYGLIPILQKQSRSYILNVGSFAAYQSIPTLAMYSATKALVNNFTRALALELKGSGTSVTLLTPGSVKTGFVARSGMDHLQELADRTSLPPEKVAEIGIKGMLAGKTEIVPGMSNRLLALALRLVPKSLPERVAASLYRKKV